MPVKFVEFFVRSNFCYRHLNHDGLLLPARMNKQKFIFHPFGRASHTCTFEKRWALPIAKSTTPLQGYVNVSIIKIILIFIIIKISVPFQRLEANGLQLTACNLRLVACSFQLAAYISQPPTHFPN